MSNSNNDGNAQGLKSSDVVTHLKKCQKIMGDVARDAFIQYLNELDEAFLANLDCAGSNQEVAELSGIQRLFVKNRDDLIHYYCGYIAEGFVKFKKKELRTVTSSKDGEQGLSLLENDELEETIAISTITQKIDAFLAEPLWALNQRFAALNGGEQVTEASNPAAPIQFCESLRKSLRLIPLSPKANTIAYKTYEATLQAVVTRVVNSLNDYLSDSGVLPDLQYNKPGSQEEGGASRITGDRPGMRAKGEGNQTSLLREIRSMQEAMLVSQEQLMASNQAVAAVFSQSQLMGALQAMQPGGVQLIAQPGSGSSTATATGGQVVGAAAGVAPAQIIIQGITDQLKQNAAEGQVSSNDMHTIDLVGMLFEYMLSDENIPDSVKTVLSYMHTPFLKLAFIDSDFFERPEHPARLLLNNLAEAGSRWVGNDDTSQFDMLEKIKGVVDRVLTEFKSDISVISKLLQEFTEYTDKLIRRQDLMEKRATEKAQGEERLREVKIQVNTEVLRRTDGKELPSPVLLFLLQPWSDDLSFALLRFGEDSEKWQEALDIVDTLLWAIEPKLDPEDITRQMDLTTTLINDIGNGFETIGYDQGKATNLLLALSSLIKSAAEHKTLEPAPAPVRDELEKVAAEKAGTVVQEPVDISAEEAKFVEHLKMIEFGTWFEFDGGKRLKVAWFNARTSNYMLVDQKGKKVAMMPGIDLAREVISKRAKIISGSSKPFFERALENIFHKLNAEAGSEAEPATEK